MTRYLASRFAGMVIVMLLVATLVFFITRLAPGDPAAVMLGVKRRRPTLQNCELPMDSTNRCRCSSAIGWASSSTAIWASRSFCSGR
jgi:ABC-type dipeptide/oligopeptide/nickel transport system permease component